MTVNTQSKQILVDNLASIRWYSRGTIFEEAGSLLLLANFCELQNLLTG